MLKILAHKLRAWLTDKHIWIAFLSGCALTFAYSPFEIWPIVFISLATLFKLVDETPPKQAFKYGFVFGLGWFGLGISWVHVSIADFGGLPLPVSILLMLLLCSYLAIYPALALALAQRLAKGYWQKAVLLTSAFAVSEWLRGTMLTGFPWLSFGYTLTDSPMAVLAPFIGEFGLTILIVFVTALAYQSLKNRAYWTLALSIVLFPSAITLTGQLKSNDYSGQSLKALLVQGNIQQSLRWAPEHFWPTMSKYRNLTRPHWHDADLVVWPEAAIPEFEDLAGLYLDNLDKAAAFNDTALILGIPDYQIDTRNAYNTLITLGKKYADDDEGHYHYLHTNRYQKHQLLPIGEFVPFESLLRPIAPLFNLAMSSFSRGEAKQNNLIANGYRILPAICYEIAFSELVRGNYHSNSDILFTVSNDAWFGDSHGPHQHMQIARMRALELQRPLIRVTNNGVTGVYDPLSAKQLALSQFIEGTLKVDVKLIQGDTWFSQYGATPVWIVIFLLTLIALGSELKRRCAARFEQNFL